MYDKIAISSYILKIVEKDPFLRLQIRKVLSMLERKKVPSSFKSNIETKVKRNDLWKEAIVTSRLGKATCKNKYWMNIKI